MDAQLQQDIIEAAQEFWIEWNYCAEHAWSYLGNDAWLDDDEEGSENNKQYKSIIDEKVEAAMTDGAICDEESPLYDEAVVRAEKQRDELARARAELLSAFEFMLTNNLATTEELVERVDEIVNEM